VCGISSAALCATGALLATTRASHATDSSSCCLHCTRHVNNALHVLEQGEREREREARKWKLYSARVTTHHARARPDSTHN
jgi:hypothetical protein